MKSVAQRFLEVMLPLDAFTVREFFVSLGTPQMGADYIISFRDGSQASLTWVRCGNQIDDVMRFRTVPNELWKSLQA